ncbi:hypothetical protein Tco_1166596 [Tanacetum coccineum]
MYLTSSRPDIMFTACACARFQFNPKISHLHAVKRIFRYLKGQPKLGLWYPKDSPFNLVSYTDSDYAGATLDRKSITGGCQFLGCRLISWQFKKQIVVANSTTEAEYIAASNCRGQIKHIEIRHHFIRDSNEKKLIQMIKIHTDNNVVDLLTKAFNFWATAKEKAVNGEVQLQALVDGKKVIVNEASVRRDLQLEDTKGTECLPNAKFFEELTRMGDPIAAETVHEEDVPTHSNDLLLSGEDSIKLNELMELCTKLQQRVLDLETTKTTQALEIDSLKIRVKKFEKKASKRTHKLKRLYKVGLSAKVVSTDDEASLGDQEDTSKQGRKIHDRDADEDITLDSTHFDTNPDMFRVHDLDGDEVIVDVSAGKKVKQSEKVAEKEVSTADPVTTASEVVTTASVQIPDELTLAQTLMEIKSAKPKAVTTAATRPKAKGLVIQEQAEQASTPMTSSKDKGKGILVEEPLKIKKKNQVLFNKEEALRLQAQFDEEVRVAREKEEANAALIAQWNDIQDKVETDYELAQRLQQEEQEELTIKEKYKLFVQLLEKRKMHFAAKRAKEKRNRPPTKAQQKSVMCIYLKNMTG